MTRGADAARRRVSERPRPATRLQQSLRWALLGGLLCVGVLHAGHIWPLPWVTLLDRAIGDVRLRAFVPGTRDPRIVIVDIDEASLARIGQWPWGRDRLAALCDELFDRQGVAVLGFDLVFGEPDHNSGLSALQRLAANDASVAARLPQWAAHLDHDARFARALSGRATVLGYYFTEGRGGLMAGQLPTPVFDRAALGGLASPFTAWDGFGANLPVLAQAAGSAGFFNFRLLGDGVTDGVLRSVPLVAEHAGRFYESLALAVYRSYIGSPVVRPVFEREPWLPGGFAGLARIELRQGQQTDAIDVDAQGGARVPYRGAGGPRGGSFEYISAADVLDGRLAARALAGKLVLLGSTAPGLYDLRATPVAPAFPGVEVHANLLSGLLDGRIAVQPDWAPGFEMLLLIATTVLLAVSLPRLRALPAAALMLALVALHLAINWWCYRQWHLELPLASALLLTALVYAGSMSWGYLVEGRSRRALARNFGTYVPPELVAEMARNPDRYDMRAENRVLTVMFCDMRDFTRVSEALAPEDVRELVNRFFSVMSGVIHSHRGTLDKYIGDAIMAFWGAPLDDPAHASNAVNAALGMCERLALLNQELATRKLPAIGLGIGLNTGLVCVGDMGSDIRRSYTVMGDAVNLSSRIEALTRHYGVSVLVGAATRAACEVSTTPGGTALRWLEVDKVRVKGKTECVTLFTPVTAAAAADPAFAEESRLWSLALAACRLQHWQQAEAGLRSLETRFGASAYMPLYRRMIERVARYQTHPPPPDWDGSHSFDIKP